MFGIKEIVAEFFTQYARGTYYVVCETITYKQQQYCSYILIRYSYVASSQENDRRTFIIHKSEVTVLMLSYQSNRAITERKGRITAPGRLAFGLKLKRVFGMEVGEGIHLWWLYWWVRWGWLGGGEWIGDRSERRDYTCSRYYGSACGCTSPREKHIRST